MRNHAARWLISVPLLGLLLSGLAWAQPAPGGPRADGEKARPRERMRQRDPARPARPGPRADAARPQLDRIFDILDTDRDGKIGRQEFARKWAVVRNRLQQGRRPGAGRVDRFRQGRPGQWGGPAAFRGLDGPRAGQRQMPAGRTGPRAWRGDSAKFAGRFWPGCGCFAGRLWERPTRGPAFRPGMDRPGAGPRMGRDANRPRLGARRGAMGNARGCSQGWGWQGRGPQWGGPQGRGPRGPRW